MARNGATQTAYAYQVPVSAGPPARKRARISAAGSLSTSG
jgi:hypothetical protein